ncbi:MAG: hypothetical protein CL735_01530 [Chloroflexi bacterium]|nr:hypothetical protein [Chloroflexota bacterium]|tara:strand:+ start:310 stop:528 length:219 start_codon:yes stop_codon:yes gene_type:complete
MIIQWIGKFSTKQIIGFVIAVLIAIYIVWYVIEALDGFDPNFKPSTGTAGSNTTSEIKGELQIFDPSKKKSE